MVVTETSSEVQSAEEPIPVYLVDSQWLQQHEIASSKTTRPWS
jgi:hypothetical protein